MSDDFIGEVDSIGAVDSIVETQNQPEVKEKRAYKKKEVVVSEPIKEEVKFDLSDFNADTESDKETEDSGFDYNASDDSTENNDNFIPEIDGKAIDAAIKLKDVDVTVRPISKNTVFDDKLTNELYDEFNSFLETKAEIVANAGVKEIIPTGITLLDSILGGGFAVGAFHTVVGSPGSGKSMLCMQVIGSAQRKYKGLLAGFLDSEEATTSQRLSNLGVKNPKIRPVTDITIEKVFKYIETVCLFKQQKKIDIPSVVVWDSIANTLSQKEREAEDINSVIGYKARMLSLLVPKYVGKCAANNICFIAVNQLREELSMGPYSAPKDLRFLSTGKSLPGGTVLKYNAFTLLEMRAAGALTADKFGFDGILVKLKVVKNKVAPPGIEIELVGDFVNGFSDIWTSWYFLAKMKYIQTGAWNYLKNYPEKKIRTKDFPETYKTDSRFKEEFDSLILECVEKEIMSKYKVDEED